MSRSQIGGIDAIRSERPASALGVQPGQTAQAPPSSAITPPQEHFEATPGDSEAPNQHSPVPKILQTLGASGSQPSSIPHHNIVEPPQGMAAANAAPSKPPPPVPPMSPSLGSGASSGSGGNQGGRSFLQFSGGMSFSGGLGGTRYGAYQPG